MARAKSSTRDQFLYFFNSALFFVGKERFVEKEICILPSPFSSPPVDSMAKRALAAFASSRSVSANEICYPRVEISRDITWDKDVDDHAFTPFPSISDKAETFKFKNLLVVTIDQECKS